MHVKVTHMYGACKIINNKVRFVRTREYGPQPSKPEAIGSRNDNEAKKKKKKKTTTKVISKL